MVESTKSIEKNKNNLSIMLRRAAIIGVVFTGAMLTTTSDNNTVKKSDVKTVGIVAEPVVHKNNGNGLTASFDELGVLGLATTGIASGLYIIGRKLDKITD